MLMVRLVLDMLARRTSGGPVPVLASLASWNPADQDLHGWLAAQLTTDHPGLAVPAPPGVGTATRVQALLAAGLILPVLDGLDEIPEAARGPAITRINDALRPGEPLVLTCRAEQYRDAVRPPLGVEVTLRAAAVVQLCPLNTDAVSDYLRVDAGGPIAAARWDPVVAALGTDEPAGQALATPLMAALARTIYNPRPGEPAENLRDPAELCGPALGDRAAVERYLFAGFIPAAYRPGTVGRWTAEQAEPWLMFLARHLEHTIVSPDLAWWQLCQAPAAPRLVLALVKANGTAEPSHGVRFSLRAAAVALKYVLAFLVPLELVGALSYALLSGHARALAYARSGWHAGGLAAAFGLPLAVGLLLALLVGLAFGLNEVPDLAVAASPRGALVNDRRAALLTWLAAGAVPGLILGMLGWVKLGLGLGLGLGLALGLALLTGLVVGGWFSTLTTAWLLYRFTCAWLAMRHQLPWPLMSFLADAHRRGVLRQAGAVYQFRHIELQHRLANRDANEQQTSSSTA